MYASFTASISPVLLSLNALRLKILVSGEETRRMMSLETMSAAVMLYSNVLSVVMIILPTFCLRPHLL